MAADSAERVTDLVHGVTTKFSVNWVSTLTSGRLPVGVAATLCTIHEGECSLSSAIRLMNIVRWFYLVKSNYLQNKVSSQAVSIAHVKYKMGFL